MVQLRPVQNILKNDKFQKFAVLFMLFAGVVFLSMINSSQQTYNFKVGDVSDVDIFAPYDVVDKEATLKKAQAAEANVQPIYRQDLSVQMGVQKEVQSFFAQLAIVQKDTGMTEDMKIRLLNTKSGISLKRDYYETLLSASEKDLTGLEDDIIYIVNQVLGDKVSGEQLNEKRAAIRDFFDNLPKQKKLNEIGAELAVLVLKPNMFYDEPATKNRMQQARQEVDQVVIKKGTVIVSKGQELTESQMDLLKQYGLLSGKNERNPLTRIYLGSAVLIVVGIIILAIYLFRYDEKTWRSNAQMLLLVLLILLSLIIGIVSAGISEYMILLPAGTMLISILINPRLAIVSTVIMTFFTSILLGFNQITASIMILSGILSALMVSKSHHRSVIILAGLGVCLASDLIILSFGLISFADNRKLLIDMMYGLAGGVLSSILTIGTLPFLEHVFDLITPIKLLELSNPNQPLLRRLLIEAPGTYYHSILVGNLSEAAAEEVGADSLLCRAGAYYHDIGKLKRPYFFKENQMARENPHDKITPNLSVLIITSHVKDGIELAKKNKLPSTVVNIIKEHHGNTLVVYFYHKALNSEGAEQVTEDKYRYAFPRPQSKEAAIVMLADSVEAYIRSLTEPTQQQVEEGVEKIIRDKLNDRQLDECELTLKDLDRIAKAFVKVLAGIFHDRIEYPENIKDI